MKLLAKSAACLMLCLVMALQMTACKKEPAEGSSSTVDSANVTESGTVSEDFWADPNASSEAAESDTPGSSQGANHTTSKGDNVTVSRPSVTSFQFPSLKFNNKTVKVMATNAPNKKYVEKLKSQYGLTVETTSVAWADLPLKLSAAVLADSSPDMVEFRADNPDMPSFVIKNLVQPINSYVNLNDSMYSYLSQQYKDTSWGGKNYLLITDYSKGSVLFYNTKLFKDYGVEDPWTLYKNGKWDWNKFAEVATEFVDDTNKDGVQDRFGFVLSVPPSLMIYTTGETFGSFDGANKQIVNNIKSANIARSMNFMHDLLFKKKGGNSSMPTAGPLFKSGIAAMMFGDAEYTNDTTLTYLAGKGQLGIVPLPKDPQAKKQYYYSRLGGYFIARGAKNPTGAIAYNAVVQYFKQDKNQQQAMRDELKALKYSDLNIQQLEENWNSGTPVFELTPFIGYNSVWMSFQNETAWATQVAQDAAKIQNTIDEIYETEVEAPTGPKVVDNFEKYGTSTTAALSKYIAEAGGSANIKMYLDSKSPYQGKYNARIDYTISGADTYACISRSLNSTWATNNTMTFWAKGDGKSDQVMTIQIKSSNGAPFEQKVTLTGTGKTYSLKLSDFKLAEWWPNKGDQLDLTTMSSIGFMFEEKGSARSAYIDMIEAVNK